MVHIDISKTAANCKSLNIILSARALTTFMMSNNELTRNKVVKNYVAENDVTNSCYTCKTESLITIHLVACNISK